ncbi:hypothetical protein V8F33_003510 [Rhypophila sp. PSN 637]
MCIFYHFRCPLCRRFSSNETRALCEEGAQSKQKRCTKPVRINRWVGREQFLEGWHCANRACDYSCVSQAVFEADIEDIITSQTQGSPRPADIQDPQNSVNFSTLGSAADLQAFESSATTSRGVKRRRATDSPSLDESGVCTVEMYSPVADMGLDFDNDQTAENGVRKRQKLSTGTEATESQTHTPTTEDGAPAKRGPHRKDWVDLKTLDADTQRIIRTLRANIDSLGSYGKGSLRWWATSESQLLAMCTDLKIPVRQTVTYLPRHNLQECQARLAYLRGIAKDRRLAPRKVKVPVAAERSSLGIFCEEIKQASGPVVILQGSHGEMPPPALRVTPTAIDNSLGRNYPSTISSKCRTLTRHHGRPIPRTHHLAVAHNKPRRHFLESIHPNDLTEVHPGSSDTEILADIVFVHGLMGHPVKTWLFGPVPDAETETERRRFRVSSIFRSKKGNESIPSTSKHAYWPLFLSEVGNFRILTYGYDSHPVRLFSPTNQMSITNHAEQLMTKVNWRRADCPGRPLIFVSHSLGGILVKAAIAESSRSPGFAPDLAKSCRAIFFIGTPHMGSSAAQFGLFLKNIITILPLSPQVEDSILKGLSPDSQDLYNITRDFNSIIDKDNTRRLRICCIQEGSPASGVRGFARKIGMVLGCLRRFFLPESTRGRYKFYVQNANHMAMCRFRSLDDPGYRDFCSKLLAYVTDIQSEKAKELEVKWAAEMEQAARETRVAMETQRSFLDKLHFPERLLREHQLESLMADPISLAWVWKSELASWLSATEPFFWVNEKPGSGKSTLIHHIAQSEELRRTLPHHPTGHEKAPLAWLVVHHFFDFRGQRGAANSFVGFLRSLLFSLVKQDAGFASEMAASPDIHLGGELSGAPTENEWLDSPRILKSSLLEGLRAVLQLPDRALVLFVDGLDEYEGNKTDLAQFVQDLISVSHADNFKICFSSRFEPPFSTLFRRYPSMSVDKENMAGIRRWSEVKMGRIFGADERDFIETMADAVSTGSEGVFLWTKFALDKVIDGRTKGFDTNEILDNLRQLPRDMVKLYERIIDRKTSEERKETGLLMVLFLGAHNQNDLTLSQLLEAMVLAQLPDTHDLTKIKPVVIDEKMLVNFRLRISHISGGMIETVQKRLESNQQVPAYEIKDVNFKPRMQVGMRVMHRTVETYMDSAEASNQLYEGYSGREMMYGSWLRVCARHLQGSWVRWSDLDDKWFFVKIPYQLVRFSDPQDPGLLHEWEFATVPEDTEPQSQSFPFSHRIWKSFVLRGPRLSKPPEAFWHSVHSARVEPSSRLWLVSGKGPHIAQISLQSHVLESVPAYAAFYEAFTGKSCWALTKDLFTIGLFHAHYSWFSAWHGCAGCHSARQIQYNHLGVMTKDMPGASLAVWHDLAGFLHDLFERKESSNLDMQALFQYAAARACVMYNNHDRSRYTLHTIEHWSRVKNQPLAPIPSDLVIRALQFSACEDIEIILSVHGPGSILLTGLRVCQFFLVLPGTHPCGCTRSKIREPCPTVECRPLFALCFGPGSYGHDVSSSDLDVSTWLVPRLKLLTSRGEDINGICGPHDSTALQTAVSLLIFHQRPFG